MSLRGWSHGSPNKSKMAAAAIFNFGKMSITGWRYLHQILWEDACGDDHVTKSRNRKLIRVSMWRHQINVCSISASTSVTITDTWTKFGTEHKYNTINTPEWPNSHKLKIQDGGGRYLEFRKNVNNSRLDKDICTKFYGMMHHGHAEMITWLKVEIGS